MSERVPTPPTGAELASRIAERGRWKISFHPATSPQPILDLSKAFGLLQSSAVDITGWDYPHVPTVDNEYQAKLRSVGNQYVEGLTDYGRYKEIVRLYPCGLFGHSLAFWEDWIADDSRFPENQPLKRIEPGTLLDPFSINRIVTEAFMFLRNLVGAGLYSDVAVVNFELRGVAKRKLVSLDPFRMPLRDDYICLTETLTHPPKAVRAGETTDYLGLAADVIEWIYRGFNWYSIQRQGILDHQTEILKRR